MTVEEFAAMDEAEQRAVLEAIPEWRRQTAEFVQIMQASPCAVCGSGEHNGFEGHRGK